MKGSVAITLLCFVTLVVGTGSVPAGESSKSAKKSVERNQKGAELLGQGRIEEALYEFQRAVELDPNDPVARLNLAFTYDRQGQGEEAIAAYKQAIEMDPKNLLAYNKLGVLYNKLARYDEAIYEFENALSVNPADTPTLKNLDNAKKNKAIMEGRDNEIAELRREVDIQPDNPVALYKLGRIYAFYDRKDEALEWIGKAREKGYDDLNNLQVDPALKKLRDDPRFAGLINR